LSFGLTNPVSITGAAAGTATLTISTTAASSAAIGPMQRGVPWYVVGDAALACMLFFGWPARRRGWRRSYGGLLGLVALLALVAGGLSACAGGGSNGGNTNSGTTPGTYIVTVSGMAGTSAGQGAITVTIQ
jgi:peptidoglycan/LPS O-acetylase OafA/YrhL